MPTAFWNFGLSVASVCLIASTAAAEIERYGSLLHHSDLPGVLFLTGEIRDGDSFELRRAMRDQPIVLLVTASPGGSLYEGLQMAAILYDNEIGTYVPEAASCESSCANIFLGGFRRMAVGEIGVHQFYAGSPGSGSPGLTAAKTQYTTSDIIGIMNQFDTPPFVYEKMFGTTTMYYFKGSEKPRLNRNDDDEAFLEAVTSVDTFVAANPSVIAREKTEEAPDVTAAVDPDAGARIPSVPSEPSPSTVTWQRMTDVDFFGMDISPTGHRNVSISRCDEICRSDPNCAAWSYVTATSWCWPKSGVDNISYAPGTISMVVNGSRISPDILDRPFLEVTAKDIPGFDIFPKGLRNTTLDQCRSACELSAGCQAFTWVSKRNWCFPKYGVGSFSDQLGVISGIKSDLLP